VLGGWERWLQVLVENDDDVGVPDPTDLSWYHAPDDWHLQQLPASLDAFVTRRAAASSPAEARAQGGAR